jgi:hypothetical protein
MASGDTLLVLNPHNAVPPATLAATFDTIAGGSTPNENWPCIDFDASSSEYMDFPNLVMPQHYAGTTGITVTIVWAAPSETTVTDECRWEVALQRVNDDAVALTVDAAYAYNGVSADPPSVANEVAYDNITFTDGADMDSVAAGEMFNLRIYRDHDHADDTATGDCCLLAIHIKET